MRSFKSSLFLKSFSKEDRRDFEFYKAIFAKNFPLFSHAENKGSKIPKVLHFIWLGPKPFPQESVKNLQSWKNYHPNWVINLDHSIDECPIEGMQKHLVEEFPFVKAGPFIKKTKNYAEQSDLLRYEILFRKEACISTMMSNATIL